MKSNILRICKINFWPTAFNGDFFEFLLKQATDGKYEFVEDGNNADVVISSVFGNVQYPKEKTIFIIGENLRPNFLRCKFALSHDLDSYYGKNCYLPIWYTKIAWPGFKYKPNDKLKDHPHEQDGYGYIKLESLMTKRNLNLTKNKKKFCAMINKNPEILRLNLFAFISSSYKKVDGFGPIFGNVTKQPKLKILKDYKFCLCPENSFYPGYITEKLIEAWFAGTIPIWSGSILSKGFINQNSFINYQNFNEMGKFIQKIIRLDQNFEEYIDMYQQPLLLKKPEIKPIINFFRNAIFNIANV